ncbi:MAG: MFS transporter [Gammaproteobacteria bacterium]|nr:MFS transporter [Chromatiales bacterium]MYE48531.1 MFS transporter [Gammaproteobacteria bacterium]
MGLDLPARRMMRIGPIRLARGVTRRHALAAVYASLTTLSLLVYINLIQPYLLINILALPPSDIGSVTGRLAAVHEGVAIVTMCLIGGLSDRWGRRAFYAAGFFMMGLGYLLYPLSDSATQLTLFRAVFAIGSSTALVMFTIVAVDYSRGESRGKVIGALNVISGIGVMIMTVVMSRLPAMLENAGYDGAAAGRTVFWITAGLCFLSAIVLGLGLKKKSAGDEPQEAGPLASAITALKLGMRNRTLALTYGAAFIGRGDLAIIGIFLPLWVARSALDAGMSMGDATLRAGTLLAVHQVAVVAWAYVAGYLNDRFHKVSVMVLAFVLATVGYGALWAVGDPFALLTFAGVIVLAAGEISIVITNNALAGEQAPEPSRGAVLGFLGVFGGVGIAAWTLVGGRIFDGIGATAPFVMMILANLVVIAWALIVRRMAVSAP